MSAREQMEKLVEQWAKVANVVFDPLILIFAGTLAILYWAIDKDPGGLPAAFVTVVMIGVSSILGARLAQNWSRVSEGGVLVTRGTSAVRSLTVQMRSIHTLDTTVQKFIEDEDAIENKPDVTKRNFEEIQRSCRALLEHSVSTIEDWKEIVPEADFASQIGTISEIREELAEKSEELEELKEALEDSEGQSKEKIASLKKLVREKEAEVLQTQIDYMGRALDSPFVPSSAHSLIVNPGTGGIRFFGDAPPGVYPTVDFDQFADTPITIRIDEGEEDQKDE